MNKEHSQIVARRRRRHRRIARHRRRRDHRTAHQCRQGAAQLADEPPHLRCAALFAAREDQQGQHQESQARLCRRHRRHLGQREPAGDPARRRRLSLRRRPMGRGLQDRCPLRRHGTHRVAHGPRPGEAAALEPRRRALGQSGDFQRQLPAAHHRHQQGQRQGRVGNEPVRWPAGPAAHRRAARGQGQDHRRRRRGRPRRARLHRGARRRQPAR